jgi:dihydroorotate dehydrogenase electron transfer subunit
MMTGLPIPATITAIQTENARTKTFVFNLRWQSDPGQFLMAWLPRFDEKPFSLVDDDPVTISVAAVGPFTQLLHRLDVGDRVWLRGPLGRGFELAGERPTLVVGSSYLVAEARRDLGLPGSDES